MRVVVGLAVASAGQLVLAFASQWLTVPVVGASVETDALFAAATVPPFVVSVLVVSMSQVVLAQLARRNDACPDRVPSGSRAWSRRIGREHRPWYRVSACAA